MPRRNHTHQSSGVTMFGITFAPIFDSTFTPVMIESLLRSLA